MASNIT
ncbi:uncharacterized protein FFMR_12366 [Fusarium fujikuroi]|nr:uncharacterized protein FFMR_12366 [Fusarium fujikuroi]